MNLYLDTEFTGLQQDAQLISLALVTEQGQLFYAEFTDFDEGRLTDWHREHVLPYLFLAGKGLPAWVEKNGQVAYGNKEQVAAALKQWLSSYEQLEIWADALAYDWILFCELFGGALQLPPNIFYLPFDLVTLLKMKGLNPDIKRESIVPDWERPLGLKKHNALYDTMLLKAVFEALSNNEKV